MIPPARPTEKKQGGLGGGTKLRAWKLSFVPGSLAFLNGTKHMLNTGCDEEEAWVAWAAFDLFNGTRSPCQEFPKVGLTWMNWY